MKAFISIGCIVALAACACNEVDAPAPYGAIPTPQQLAWQKMETNMFACICPNTFTSAEWGTGEESEDIFNPTSLDCGQWVSVAREAGFGGIIITAKHHDGFCLWPNPESTHTVAQSSWRDGKGDVLKELSEACREGGVKFGVYVSPWDRNDPRYGTEEYNQAFVNTLKSIYSSYGEVFEQWFDGACGEGPNGKKQVYDWPLFNGTVLENEPDAIIFSDGGPGCRWVGNESGYAGETNWSTFRTDFVAGQPGVCDILNEGVQGGEGWIPAEVDVSIRPGWFWKANETAQVKTLEELLTIWYNSVGHNGLLLLNLPPDTRGLIDPVDSARVMELRRTLDKIQETDFAEGAKARASDVRGRGFCTKNLFDDDYDSYWATSDDTTEATLEIQLAKVSTFNRIMLQEYIPLGQRVESFTVEVPDGDGWKILAEATTIGYKRILRTAPVTADRLRISFKALACPAINTIELYNDEFLKD